MPAGRVSLRAEQFRAGGNGPEDVQAVAEADVVCGPEQRVPDEVLPQGEEIGLVRDAEALGQLRDEAVEPLGGLDECAGRHGPCAERVPPAAHVVHMNAAAPDDRLHPADAGEEEEVIFAGTKVFDEADSEAAERLRVVEFADAAPVLQESLAHCRRRAVSDGESRILVTEQNLVRFRRLGLREVEQDALYDDRSGFRRRTAEKFGQKLLFGPVVGVHEGDEASAGGVDARIAGRRDRRFVERQGADASGVFRGVAGAAPPRIVRRAVFDQDEFEIGVTLGQQALHACAEVGRCIVDRDYDSEVGFGQGHRLLVI